MADHDKDHNPTDPPTIFRDKIDSHAVTDPPPTSTGTYHREMPFMPSPEQIATAKEQQAAEAKKRAEEVNADLKRSRDRISIMIEDLEEMGREQTINHQAGDAEALAYQTKALLKRLTAHRALIATAKKETIHIYYASLNPWE